MPKPTAKLDTLGRKIFRSSAAEWVENNKTKFPSQEALAKACAKAMPCSLRHALKAVSKVFPMPKHAKRVKKLPPGLEGFRKLYSKTDRDLEKIKSAINGLLKQRGHIPDGEFRQLLDVDVAAWANYRRDFENLLVEVRDEFGRRQTVWCHPDIVDDARKYARRF